MTSEHKPPSFEDFLSWLEVKAEVKAHIRHHLEASLPHARAAREAFLSSETFGTEVSCLEPLQLMAAADSDPNGRPREIKTPSGWTLSCSYENGSLSVMVHSPEEMKERCEGRIVYLWIDATRFELGPLDCEGGAIVTFPAGIDLLQADFDRDAVKLEIPDDADKS